jgi:8-oxo-dGTP pyrophosphatase MutT (NUDIX family)
MTKNRSTYRASVKIALFNQAYDKVLLTVVPWGGYGLPGGHIEKVEQPDVALRRELKEELGLEAGQYIDVLQRKFWLAESGDRIILGYSGCIVDGAEFVYGDPGIKEAIWVSQRDIKDNSVDIPQYREFLLEMFNV